MRCCDGVSKINDQSGIQCAGLREMIQRQPLIEARHLDGIFDRPPVTVDAERAVMALGDGNNAAVNLWCGWTVNLDLFFAGRLSFGQC